MGSIRKRLLLSLILVQLVAGLIAAWAAFRSAENEFNTFLDEELQQAASAVASRGSVAPGNLTLAGGNPEHRILLQIYESSSNALYLSEKAEPLPVLEKPGFSTITRGGAEWRIYTTASGSEIIEAGQPASVRTSLAAGASLRILQPLLFLLPISALLIWLIVGQGLAPLARAARSVACRSPTSLKPLAAEGLPGELLSLVNAINNLLARLSASLDAQKRFASDAAHELRTPLTAIKLQAQLARKAATPEAREKYFKRLDDGILRATHLIEQLLTMARLDPESVKKPMAPVRLNTLLGSVKAELEPIAAQKSIAIDAESPELELTGLSDALHLMVTSLADNAIKYTPEGGRILLSARRDGHSAVVSVADNGSGIPLQDRKRVFERFYRALGTKVAGNGLGLAIVSRIVEIHGGTISAEDGLDGRGTAMVVRLPLSR